MQTGALLSRYFSQKAGADYTNFLDNTKLNRLFKDALISLIERKYTNDFEQKEWDEITFVTRTNYVLPLSNNFIVTAPLQITAFAYSAPNVTITTLLPHGLSIGDTVTLQNIGGITSTPAINGSVFTLTAVTANTFTFATFGATGTYTAGTGQVTSARFLNDYWHLLSMKIKFSAPIYNLTISDAINTSPIKIVVNERNNIRTGEQITIAGVLGNTNANGTFYVKNLNNFTFSLYSDSNFQNPVTGNGNYISGGSFSRTSYNYGKPYTSSAKIGVLNIPTVINPCFENADNQIKLYPLDVPSTETTIDYIRQPNVVIDVTDAVTDLTSYYPEKFLFAVVDEALVIYGILSRDNELIQDQTMEQQKNP